MLAAVTALAACGPGVRPSPAWPDAPVELRDDGDRDLATDQLWVMPHGPARDRARARIAAAIVPRIADAIEHEEPELADALFDELTWMWHADPAALRAGLAGHAGVFQALRAMFAKSGSLEPTVQLLVLLAEIEPDQRTARLAELDEVLAFADELAVTEHGEHARRAEPIRLLQPTALALPLPWLVDRYVALVVQRQRAVAVEIDQHGASIALIRAHRDMIATAARIANVLARAGRTAEIHRHLASLDGYGSDRQLTAYAEAVAQHPSATAYGDLANAVRTEQHAPDPAAALAICAQGLLRFPGNVELLSAAASDARALGRTDQAIALLETTQRNERDIDPEVTLRLGRLYGERIARLANAGRPVAANSAWRTVLEQTRARAKQHPHPAWSQAAAIAESALGRGLASQGLIADARHALRGSLDRAPSVDAYETLSTIDVQTRRFDDAGRWAATGLALLGEQTSEDRYRRAKLERLAGDALRGANRLGEAQRHYLEGLRWWASLGESKDLPPTIAAERFLETGRTMWWLDDPAQAVRLVMLAIDSEHDSPAIAPGAVAFLIQAGRYREALDAFHHGLDAAEVSEMYRVYMSLWILGEAHWRGLPADDRATEYLATRRGDTWPELLARAATSRLPFETLAKSATTGPRRAELAFYGAVLGLDPRAATPDGRRKLLRAVVSAQVVLDAEYDLARVYLADRPAGIH